MQQQRKYFCFLYQRRRIFAFMDFQVSSGKLICLQRRFLRSFLSRHLVSTLPEMGCKKRTGYPWLLSTVMHGYLQWPFTSVLGFNLIRLIGMHICTIWSMVGNQVVVLGYARGSLPLSRECGLTWVSLESAYHNLNFIFLRVFLLSSCILVVFGFPSSLTNILLGFALQETPF